MDNADKIYSEAFNLFLKYGIRSVSMDDLSRKLGVSKKTIYQYVENKSVLVSQVVKRYIATERVTMEKLASSSDNALDEMIACANYILTLFKSMKPTLVYDLQKYYPDAWDIINNDHFSFVKETIERNIERGKKEELYRNNINADIIAKLYVGKAKLIADEDVFPASKYARPELFLEVISHHLRGIVSEKGYKYLIKSKAINCDE